MQPIPTEFNGVLYRSKLEAEWACFLEHTPNVTEYTYEPKLVIGYTPDFLVKVEHPAIAEAILEVKPKTPTDAYIQHKFKHMASYLCSHVQDLYVIAYGSWWGAEIPKLLTFRHTLVPQHKVLRNLFPGCVRAVAKVKTHRFDLKG
jgi:hypothetical protein